MANSANTKSGIIEPFDDITILLDELNLDSIDHNTEFEHTPVNVLIFASDAEVHRIGWYNDSVDIQQGKPNYINYHYGEFLKRHKGIEERFKNVKKELGIPEEQELPLAELEKHPEWKNMKGADMTQFLTYNNQSRGMAAPKLAHEIRKLGYTVQVIHRTRLLTERDTEKIIRKFVGENTLAVMFGTTFHHNLYPQALMFSRFFPPQRQFWFKRWIKEINPKTQLVLGGSQYNSASELHGEDAGYEFSPLHTIDIRNLGYGDVTVKEILEDIENGTPKKLYADKTSKLDIQNSTMSYESEDIPQPEDQFPFEMGRGCIFNCAFCSFGLTGKEKGSYMRGIDRLEEEMVENWERWGIHKYFLVDDTFNDDTEKLDRLITIKEKHNIPFKFSAFLRLDLAHRLKQTEKLVAAGFTHAYWGIESLNPESAIAISKGWNPDEQMALIRELKAGIMKDVHMTSNFIFGLPEDTYDTMIEMGEKLIDLDYNHLDAMWTNAYTLQDYGQYSDPTLKPSPIMDDTFNNNSEKFGYTPINTSNRMAMKKGRSANISWVNKFGVEQLPARKMAQEYQTKWFIKKHGHQDLVGLGNDNWIKDTEEAKQYFKKLMNLKQHTVYDNTVIVGGKYVHSKSCNISVNQS